MSTKREALHLLMDSILDIEETSEKGVCFEYSTLHGVMLRFKTRPLVGSDTVVDIGYFYKMDGEDLIRAITLCEIVKNTPDVAPKVTLTLDESKARELGLIA